MSSSVEVVLLIVLLPANLEVLPASTESQWNEIRGAEPKIYSAGIAHKNPLMRFAPANLEALPAGTKSREPKIYSAGVFRYNVHIIHLF